MIGRASKSADGLALDPERKPFERRPDLIVGVLIAAVGVLAFVPSLGAGRLADDFVLLQTVRGVHGIGRIFTSNDLGQVAGAGSHFYRPLWVLFNWVVFQVDGEPIFAHAVNLTLYAVICVETFALLRRASGRCAAGFVALLFAVFPDHAESVAWISGNTDLLATVLSLGALLVATWRDTGKASLAVAVLTLAAMLAKEESVGVPLLMIALNVTRRPGLKVPTRTISASIAAVALGFVAHVLVVHGLGGYGAAPSIKRALGSLATFLLGITTPPQLRLLAHPVLITFPVVVLVAVSVAIVRCWRTDRVQSRLMLCGVAFVIVALVPVLNEPLNLNTRNGDRLLLLPSVGAALIACGLVERWRRSFSAGVIALGVGAGGVVLSVLGAINWNDAGGESTRLIHELQALAPRNAEIVALTVPTDLREAHLFPDALSTAVQQTGRPDVDVLTCAPVQVLTLQPGALRTALSQPDTNRWTSQILTSDAVFDAPVLASASTATDAGCAVHFDISQSGLAIGTAREATEQPATQNRTPIVYVAFDGRAFVRALAASSVPAFSPSLGSHRSAR